MIEWRDKRGRLNILMPDAIPFYGPQPIEPHDFEPRRYLDGQESVVTETCWCDAKADHPVHRSPSATSSREKTASGSAAPRKQRKAGERSR